MSPWAAIIAEIFKILGPFLGELLKKLLENLFKKVSKSLGDPSGTVGVDTLTLLDAARGAAKGPLVRLLLERFSDHVEEKGLVKMEGDRRKEFKALASVAA